MDVVSFFAAAVFAVSWFFLHRADEGDALTRLFLTILMVLAAAIGGLGLLLRAIS